MSSMDAPCLTSTSDSRERRIKVIHQPACVGLPSEKKTRCVGENLAVESAAVES